MSQHIFNENYFLYLSFYIDALWFLLCDNWLIQTGHNCAVVESYESTQTNSRQILYIKLYFS